MVTDLPRLSVVIATYNRHERLSKAVKSVQHQSLRDIEIIIVDDCSDVAVNLSDFQVDDRIKLVRNVRNSGIAITRNRGIARAVSAWTTFLDDDDDWHPNFAESMIEELERHPLVEFAWSDVRFINDMTGEVSYRRHIEDWSDVLFKNDRIGKDNFRISDEQELKVASLGQVISIGGGFGLTIKTSVLHKMGGFRPDMIVAEDTDIMIRLAASGLKYTFLRQPLVNINNHNSMRLTDLQYRHNIRQKTIDILNNHKVFFEEYPALSIFLRSYVEKLG